VIRTLIATLAAVPSIIVQLLVFAWAGKTMEIIVICKLNALVVVARAMFAQINHKYGIHRLLLE